MNMQGLFLLLPLIAPALLIIYGSSLALSSDKAKVSRKVAEGIALIGIVISIISAIALYQYGTMQSSLIGWAGLGFSLRMDALSVSIFIMIAILGFIILRFSVNYLDGESRKAVFFSRLAITIASVELLILSGNLFQILAFWIITSMCLHSLLVFYRSRPQAIAAARKKFVLARLGDVSLLVAIVCIYLSMGTGDLQTLFEATQAAGFQMNALLSTATVLLVLTAVLKSAQFPTHGWLIEVVETPTPVSALLHAGLLNAGPFLMARMSYLMIESTSASMMLIIIGGLTALFASVVFLTQPSVKVALGYSSVAHMGFSLLLCGFGVYAAAILHVVAHSFYKAHSFLSSGSAVEVVRSHKVSVPKRKGNILRIALSISVALSTYLGFSYLWGIQVGQNISIMAVGLIIVMGLSQILTATIDSAGKLKAVGLAIGMTLLVSLSFFTLEHGARSILNSQLPALQEPTTLVSWTIIGLLSGYGLVTLLQLISPLMKSSGFGYRLGIHLRNGFYANVIFDRMIGSLKNEKFKWANLTVQEHSETRSTGDEKIQRTEVLLNN